MFLSRDNSNKKKVSQAHVISCITAWLHAFEEFVQNVQEEKDEILFMVLTKQGMNSSLQPSFTKCDKMIVSKSMKPQIAFQRSVERDKITFRPLFFNPREALPGWHIGH